MDATMTDDEIRDAVTILKQRGLRVGALTTTAEQHVEIIELIVDCEAILRGFPTLKRSREEIERTLEQALKV